MNRHARLITTLCGAVLIASLVGLGAGLVVTLDQWRSGFDRAALSQAQLAAASGIEAEVYGSAPSSRLDGLLRRYRKLIAAETAAFAPSGPGLRGQQEEAARAQRLSELAHRRGTESREELHRLVAAIVANERSEAAAVRDGLLRLQSRMTLLVVLLILAAGGSAALGAWGLVRANRRLTREVVARTSELAAIDRARRLFFAKVSHELRTPVTVMRGEAEVALADPVPNAERLSGALRHVVANAEFLGHRIDELLQLARAEEGALVLDEAPLDLSEVLCQATQAARRFADSVEVPLQVETPGTPVMVRGDARWLGQAIVAVLDNGIKFSPVGDAVTVRLQCDEHRAMVEIADRGPGITAAELPRIFDPYYQAEAGRQRGGTGLGLALARWIVERHGGSVAAANDARGGCVISLSVPRAA